MACFFKKHRPASIDDIDHYEDIRYEHQKEIRETLGATSAILLPETSKGKGKKGKKRAAESISNAAALKDFGVEYSKTSRAMCAGCGNNIMKDVVRIKHIDYTTEVGMKFGGQPIWHHVDCFAKIRGDYNFYLGGEVLPGYENLSPADKKILTEAVTAIELTESQAKKLKSEPRDKDEVATENKLEDLIAKQTKQLFKVRDAIKPITTKSLLNDILNANGSGMVEGADGMLDRVADFLTFGAISKCQKCNKGDMIFAKYGYMCNGNVDEWTLCENFEVNPKRVKCKIPTHLKGDKKEGGFFVKYKPKIEDRAVRPKIDIKIKKDEDGKRHFKLEREKEPLYGMHCILLGQTVAQKDDLKKKIVRLGGKVVTKFQDKIAFVVSNAEEVEKLNMRMMEAKSFEIQVVPDSFIEAIENDKRAETIEKIKSMSISPWGSDPLIRIPQEEDKTERVSFFNFR